MSDVAVVIDDPQSLECIVRLGRRDSCSDEQHLSISMRGGQGAANLQIFKAERGTWDSLDVAQRRAIPDESVGLVFIVDPISISAVSQRMSHRNLGSTGDNAIDEPMSVLERVLAATSSLKRDGMRIALVVSKSDRFGVADEIANVGSDETGAEVDPVRQWLLDQAESNFVLTLEQSFSQVKYFTVSSTVDHTGDILAPISWLLQPGSRASFASLLSSGGSIAVPIHEAHRLLQADRPTPAVTRVTGRPKVELSANLRMAWAQSAG